MACGNGIVHVLGGPLRLIYSLFQVNAVCYGAKVLLPGVLRFDEGMEPGMEIAIMSTKGEAVALGEGVFLTTIGLALRQLQI